MLRENSQRAKNAVVAFWIFLGTTIIALGGQYLERELLVRALDGHINLEEVTANNLRQRVLSVLQLLLYLAVIISFIMWFRRAYFNLHALGYNCRHTEGWAAGAWFVPIVNLYAPYQIMKEIWSLTQERAQHDSDDPSYQSSAILGLWWTLWLIANFLGNLYLPTILTGHPSIRELVNTHTITIVVYFLNIVNIFIIITIIKRISGFEDRLRETLVIENIAADSPPAPFQ